MRDGDRCEMTKFAIVQASRRRRQDVARQRNPPLATNESMASWTSSMSANAARGTSIHCGTTKPTAVVQTKCAGGFWKVRRDGWSRGFTTSNTCLQRHEDIHALTRCHAATPSLNSLRSPSECVGRLTSPPCSPDGDLLRNDEISYGPRVINEGSYLDLVKKACGGSIEEIPGEQRQSVDTLRLPSSQIAPSTRLVIPEGSSHPCNTLSLPGRRSIAERRKRRRLTSVDRAVGRWKVCGSVRGGVFA
ncbi:hypothetical protein BC629DRAFT_596737 [Irpex lacteus]|nr:hypothetical protein BC629DRAFT_596737 [Irpex lacteus]